MINAALIPERDHASGGADKQAIKLAERLAEQTLGRMWQKRPAVGLRPENIKFTDNKKTDRCRH
ncbi:hypothetical protein GKN89_18695 [Serratia sp. YC16]|uniref:Uncharacterized protein n=1 Tax=Serratia surfactantfaciens TaxID=2741499 RepID=A0ABS0M6P4_9GAMM|nr:MULTISPECIES: hypothetical protein [Serratia]AOF00508.1 hypothetical protein ATE40_015050 [Serratia surfactantfaciens]MBH1922485.1 hypothetical protein [Serratia surfactantfaciens]MTD08750.1 hypothetical protein [Serratia sp. YC16]